MKEQKPTFDQWRDDRFEPLGSMPMERSIVADVSAQLPDRERQSADPAPTWPRYAILTVAVVLGVLGCLQLSVVELMTISLQSAQQTLSMLPGQEWMVSRVAEAGSLGSLHLLLTIALCAALLSTVGLSLLED